MVAEVSWVGSMDHSLPPSTSLPGASGGPTWLSRIAELPNLAAAWDKVRRNAGAPGVDGVTVAAFERAVSNELSRLRLGLMDGSYRPRPVRAVDIPKPSGGLRTLGIPTVADRVVQQAVSQVLTPVWEALFSPSSHAYRRGHDAHDAVAQVQQHLTAGRPWVVDLDIEKFFDRIHHDRLLEQLHAQVPEAAVLTLIRQFLEAGVLRSGYRLPTTEGTPQGSPLSPLLANIVLDALDQHLDAQGQPFSRYADDVVLLCATEAEGHSALEAARAFLAERLQLRLNESKTRLCTPPEVTFLGFAFHRDAAGAWRRVISAASMEAFRTQVDEITAPEGGSMDVEAVSRELAAYVHGWENYYRHDETATTVKRLRAHARTAMRRLIWQQWGTPERRVQELVRRGISAEAAAEFVTACPDAATAASSPVLGGALPNAFFATCGLAPAPAVAAMPYDTPAVSGLKSTPARPAPFPAAKKQGAPPAAPETKSFAVPSGEWGLHLGLCLGLGPWGGLRGALDLRLPIGPKKGAGTP